MSKIRLYSLVTAMDLVPVNVPPEKHPSTSPMVLLEHMWEDREAGATHVPQYSNAYAVIVSSFRLIRKDLKPINSIYGEPTGS